MGIEGRIARILDESTLVVNRGAEHDVRMGMRFVIFAEGDEIVDPESGEVLGRHELPKGILEAVHVQPKMTTCRPAAAVETPGDRGDPSTRVLSAEMVDVSRMHAGGVGKLAVKRSDLAGRPSVSAVGVGDRVRSLDLPGAEGKDS